jgi:hypothetical protein
MSVAATRRAFTLVEACAAGAMLTLALSLALTTIGAMKRQQRTAEWRLQAVEIAENLLERATSERWDELTPGRLAQLQTEAKADELLPDGELQLTVEEQAGPPPGKRIGLELSWQPGPTTDRRRVRLTTWVFREGGADE